MYTARAFCSPNETEEMGLVSAASTVKEAQKFARTNQRSFLLLIDEEGKEAYYAFLYPSMNDKGSRRWYRTDNEWNWE